MTWHLAFSANTLLPTASKGWLTKVSWLWIRNFYNYIYSISTAVREQLALHTSGTTCGKMLDGQGAREWRGAPTFFWEPQVTASSSSRPWRWREEKQPMRNTDRSVAVLLLERRWHICLRFKAYFFLSWPKTSGFADQFSCLEQLGIRFVLK